MGDEESEGRKGMEGSQDEGRGKGWRGEQWMVVCCFTIKICYLSVFCQVNSNTHKNNLLLRLKT